MSAGEKRVRTGETILVSLVGKSPAVLTETIWALAHRKDPVVPDRVVVLTTRIGKERLNADIRSSVNGKPSIWDRLRETLAKTELPYCRSGMVLPALGDTSIRVCPDREMNELEDLRCVDDNERMADFLLEELRKYTEAPDMRVIVSIAGGRKTMSALMFSCMSLLGRDCDSVYHVLVNAPFDTRLDPPFFFPEPGAVHTSEGGTFPASAARIELFEVPFVRMRGWYQNRFKTLPPSYGTLVARMRKIAPEAVVYPKVELDVRNKTVTVGGKALYVSDLAFALLILLSQRIHLLEDLMNRLLRLKTDKDDRLKQYNWIQNVRYSSRFNVEDEKKRDLAKVLSELRATVANHLPNAEVLVPKRGRPVTFPTEKIVWKNIKEIADICGYLFPAMLGADVVS